MENKFCNKCKITKTVDKFSKSSENSDGLQSKCKDCAKDWSEQNRERRKIQNKERYLKNKPLINAMGKIWRENNFGYSTKCVRKWRENNPGVTRDLQLKRDFGISLDEYKQILEKQKGVCAICRGRNKCNENISLAVDHNHITGKIRGLLCLKCNLGIGAFKDNIDLLEKAYSYLLFSTAQSIDAFGRTYKDFKPGKSANTRHFLKITKEKFREILLFQNHLCKICKNPKPSTAKRDFCVDHDHISGKIRGILCPSCNKGLGQLCDSPALFLKAIAYLKKNP